MIKTTSDDSKILSDYRNTKKNLGNLVKKIKQKQNLQDSDNLNLTDVKFMN
jgi:hypothetical protein